MDNYILIALIGSISLVILCIIFRKRIPKDNLKAIIILSPIVLIILFILYVLGRYPY